MNSLLIFHKIGDVSPVKANENNKEEKYVRHAVMRYVELNIIIYIPI